MIALRSIKLQPALLALEDSTKVESPAGGLGSDPLHDEAQQERRRTMATVLCQYAATPCAWELADKLARSWGFSCSALGVVRPADPEGERRRKGVVQRG